MPNHKVNPFDKKKPFNLSISSGVIECFENYCNELNINKNEIAESLIVDFLGDFLHSS